MNETLNKIKKLIEQSNSVLIGAGSGLSTSAGIKVNLRKDGNFVQDDEWYRESKNYLDLIVLKEVLQ